MLKKRRSGLLLHITSLPSKHGIGDLGPAAFEFANFCERAGVSLWQLLPLNPTDPATGNAPYSSISAFAGNPLLISTELLEADGYLTAEETAPALSFSRDRVDFDAVIQHRGEVFKKAFARFQAQKGGPEKEAFQEFVIQEAHWLHDFALFVALKDKVGKKPWVKWPEELRDRHEVAMETASRELLQPIEYAKFLQFTFFKQLKALRERCAEGGVVLLGDLPIYVSHDSADVWANRELFKLHPDGRRKVQAGVPPDYFSKTGQLWGNPVYRWDVLAERGYDWWLRRLERSLELFDCVRIDHFRGFAGYWEVPASHKTAMKGRWMEGPGDDFFKAVQGRFSQLPVVAEDLGTITPDVRALMKRFSIPGTKVLLFAFGGDFPQNAYAPHNHVEDAVVYTGTHDNNTARGWLEDEATDGQKTQLFGYIGRRHDMGDAAWELVRLALQSVSRLAILPVQDLLGLGSEARMNRPATAKGNWGWRLRPGQLSEKLALDLRELNWLTHRIPSGSASEETDRLG